MHISGPIQLNLFARIKYKAFERFKMIIKIMCPLGNPVNGQTEHRRTRDR